MNNNSLPYKIIGYLGIPIALYNLYYFKESINLLWGLFFLGSILLALGTHQLKQLKPSTLFIVLSGLISTAIYLIYPNVFVDDTGFVIRYFDQASNGCFYCYNAEDGPIFGISSFLYGFVGSIIALPGILKPEYIIFFLNFTGLWVLLYFLFKTIQQFIQQTFLNVLAVIFTLVASSKLLLSATIGLETNFHLAIVMATVYFFASNQHKRMFLFMALSVISKLDTVPLMLVLAATHLIVERKRYFGQTALKHWTILLKYALVPVLLYVGLTYILFDGPMPQSAYAKIYHHEHPTNHWFPFGELMYLKGPHMSLLKTALALVILHIIIGSLKRDLNLKSLALFGGFLGTLLLFYFYNPAERMVWYYAMPELLIYGQMIISGMYIIKWSSNQINLKAALLYGALIIAAFPMTRSDNIWYSQYFKTVEVERMYMGKYIGRTLSSKDTLVASHGYFGAYTNAYVLDMSGLNSKLATDYKRNLDSVLLDYRPDYYIHHGDDYLFYLANIHGYHIDTAGFNINCYAYPTWTLFKRNEVIKMEQGRISKESITGVKEIKQDGATYSALGQNLEITLNTKHSDSVGIWMGLESGIDSPIDVEISYNNHKLETVHLQRFSDGMELPHTRVKTMHFTLPVSDSSSKATVMIQSSGTVRVYDPIFEKYLK